MTAELKETVTTLQHEREAARLADYHKLVDDYASGAEPDPENVINTLDASGKSYDDLERDAERQREVVRLQSIIDRRGEHEQAVATAERRVAELQGELAAISNRLWQQIATARAESEMACCQLSDCVRAQHELQKLK